MLISINHCISLGCTGRICRNKIERSLIPFQRLRRVTKAGSKLSGNDLRPYGAGHGVSECRADVVESEVYTRNNSDVYFISTYDHTMNGWAKKMYVRSCLVA